MTEMPAEYRTCESCGSRLRLVAGVETVWEVPVDNRDRSGPPSLGRPGPPQAGGPRRPQAERDLLALALKRAEEQAERAEAERDKLAGERDRLREHGRIAYDNYLREKERADEARHDGDRLAALLDEGMGLVRALAEDRSLLLSILDEYRALHDADYITRLRRPALGRCECALCTQVEEVHRRIREVEQAEAAGEEAGK